MQDRMDAQMRALRRRCIEMIPELRRLITDVPIAFEAARREHALLGARGFLVAADAGNQAVETVFAERHLEALGLARGGTGGRRQRWVDGINRRAGLDAQIEIPLLAVVIAEAIHFRKLLAGVDMEGRERQAAEKRLACQPDHDVGVLAERPQQGDLLQTAKSLAEDVDALGLELVEMVHARGKVGRKFLRGRALGKSGAARPASSGTVLEKMHLCHFAFGGENSIVAVHERRKNFLFARSKRHIYRK